LRIATPAALRCGQWFERLGRLVQHSRPIGWLAGRLG
jgi:hypothetical protein